jgi:hypothetical protein
MTAACSCNVGLGNTGHPNCPSIGGVTHSLIFVPYFTSAGVKNGINLSTATLDSTYFNALTAQSDRMLRWRPVNTGKPMEEVDINRAEAKYKTFPSGQKYYVQDGEKTFKATLPLADPGLVKFFDSMRCEKVGVFVVDREGNLIGNKGTAGYLYPFRVADGTADSYFMHPKDGEVTTQMLRFDFDMTERDGDIGMIEATDMSYDVKLLTGLYDVYGEFSSITTTGFIVDLRTYFGSASSPNRVTGMVSGDFVLTNRGTGATITITSVTENTVTAGIYTFVIPAQTSGHKLKLTATETGYDFNVLSTYKILIP